MRAILLAAAIFTLCTSVRAATVYSTSFEAPQFATGALEGQNGYYYDSAGLVGQVESGISNTGSQAVAFNSSGTSGQNTSNIDTVFTSNPGDQTATVQIAAMFTSGTSGSLFEVLGINSSSGFLTQLVYKNGLAYFTSSVGNVYLPVAVNTWNTYTIQIDYTSQTASGYLNGNLIGTRAFYTPSTDLAQVGFGINQATGDDTGYFDDLSVTSQTPEPSSLILLATGALGLAGAARRRLFLRRMA